MFFELNQKEKRIAAFLLGVFLYILFTGLLSWPKIVEAENIWLGILPALSHLWIVKLLLCGALVYLAVFMFDTSLDVKAQRVGDGQHGNARYMTPAEKAEVYKQVKHGHEMDPAILVGQDNAGWLVDTSDNNMLLIAPPGGGKTKRVYIPSIYYNAKVNKNTGGKGASMVIMDIKGELYRSCSGFLKEAGYRMPILDFRKVFQSSHYQLMYKINKAIDKYLHATDNAQRSEYYGQAERYAKVLSTSLVDNVDNSSKSEASEYFNETAKGLLTGIILLVSEYALPDERHIVSVFSMIMEMNGQSNATTGIMGEPQKSKLDELLEYIENRRIMNYTGAATSADMRTLMNVFSSALSKLTKFIDAELEQIICDHSQELNDTDFIKDPTAIFVICPDENTTRHFFASLFIRYFSNDLIEQAENEHNGVLPRQVIYFCDEFGNMPEIKDVDVLFAAIRSRGVRIIISIQSYSQLFKNYSKEKAQIIQDTCQMVMSGFVAPSAYDTAKHLSEMLGNETVMTGSASKGHAPQTTHSMVGKPLVSMSEMVTLPHGTFIVQKGGYNPLNTELDLFFNYLKIDADHEESRPQHEFKSIHVASGDRLIKYLSGEIIPLTIGMFD